MKRKSNILNLNQDEINSLNDEQFNLFNPFLKRSCADCSSLTAAVSLWCSNEEAIDVRGTRIPGCIKCPFWTPDADLVKRTSSKDNLIHKVVCPDGKEFIL